MRYLIVLFACAACGPNTSGLGPGDSERPDASDETGEVDEPGASCDRMDILFVIDNSGSMGEEQMHLANNFPAFAQIIDAYRTPSGDPLDYRIAVTTAGRTVSYTVTWPGVTLTTTETGDNGAFRMGCGMTRRWIERDDPDVVGTFSCVAQVGTGGPGAEMPLLGLEWSLDQRVADGTNAGFLREDALLATVIITDQDDCSRNDDGFIIDGTKPSCFDPADPAIIPLGHYLDFLDDLKGDRARWASAVIAGTGPGVCNSGFGAAAQADRMMDFASQVGDNGVLSTLCQGDLTQALEDALDTFQTACEEFPPIE